MNFFGFLKSLDNLLFEVMSWIIFYPITLWRCLVRPLSMMAYAQDELKNDEQPFGEALSPPIFLLITVVVAHGVELAAIGQSALVTQTTGLAALVTDDTTLIVLRLIIFATIPTIMAVQTLWWSKRKLDRANLERPFYAQCYAVTPLVLVVSLLATWVTSRPDGAGEMHAIGYLAVLAWFLVTQVSWFRGDLQTGIGRSMLIAGLGLFQSLVAVLLFMWLVVGGIN